MSDNYIQQIELVQGGNTETINIGSPHMVSVEHGDLVKLRDGGKLVEGTWYRLTNYLCENVIYINPKYDLKFDKTEHNFDIIILALSNDTLSEECRAIKKDGDTYFEHSNLDAWKVWYKLGDGSDNSKGVIYRLIDEWGNDCPYDFKNIKWEIGNDIYHFTFDNGNGKDASVENNNGSCVNNKVGVNSSGIVFASKSDIKNNNIGCGCCKCEFYSNSIDNVNIGNGCSGISIGEEGKFVNSINCFYVGDNCTLVNSYDDCQYVKIGNGCYKIFLHSDKSEPMGGKYRHIVIEDNIFFISLTNSSELKEIRNVHIHTPMGHVGEKVIIDLKDLSSEIEKNNKINISLDGDTSKGNTNDRLICWIV